LLYFFVFDTPKTFGFECFFFFATSLNLQNKDEIINRLAIKF